MMKKILFTASVSAALLLSGCTIPFMEEDNIAAISTDQANSQAQENPEQLFFDFAKASGEKTMEKINKWIPDKELLVKNKGKMSIVGDFNMEGTPIGGGTGTFSLIADAKTDYSNKENPLLSETIEVKVNALGGLIKIEGNGEFRVVDNSMFAIVNALDINIPGVTKDIETTIQKFVGQWYGDTFEKIEELAGDELNGLNLQKAFSGGTEMIKIIDIIEDINTQPANHISFVKFVEEKDGYYFFEVTPKKETYERIAEIGINMIPLAGDEREEMETNMQTIIDGLSTQNIILAYTPENPEYFKISTLDGNAKAERTSEGFLVEVKNQNDSDEIIIFEKKGDNFSLTRTEGETTNEYLNGVYTGNTLTFNIISESYDSETTEFMFTPVLVGSFTATDNIWSGEITSPEMTEGKLLFTDFSATATDIKGTISAQYNENIVGNITINFSSSKPDSVTVTKPENIKSFTIFGEEIEKETNALYGINEEVTINPESITIEKTEDENIESEETENTNLVPDPNNIPTDISIPEVSTISTTPPLVETVPVAKDTAEIDAILNEMAAMMINAPTEETQAEFLKMKESIDVMAKEQNINEVELTEMFQKAILNNAPQSE